MNEHILLNLYVYNIQRNMKCKYIIHVYISTEHIYDCFIYKSLIKCRRLFFQIKIVQNN